MIGFRNIINMESTPWFEEVRRTVMQSENRGLELAHVWQQQNELAYAVFSTFDFAERKLILLNIVTAINHAGCFDKKGYLLDYLLKQLIFLHKRLFYKKYFKIDVLPQERSLFDRSSLFLTALSILIGLILACTVVGSFSSLFKIQNVPNTTAIEIIANMSYDSGFTINKQANQSTSNITGVYNNASATGFATSIETIALVGLLTIIFCLVNRSLISKWCYETDSFVKDCLVLSEQEMVQKYTVIQPLFQPAADIMNDQIVNGLPMGIGPVNQQMNGPMGNIFRTGRRYVYRLLKKYQQRQRRLKNKRRESRQMNQ